MADIYKFKVKLREPENCVWRDIEVTSVSSVAKLGYTILAAFEAEGSHLFCIKHGNDRYEITFYDDFFDDFEIEAIDPISKKLTSLKLNPGDMLTLEYDYGAGWMFDIELISIFPMEKGTGTHYPYITDGMGWGIIEDICADELSDYIANKKFDLHISNRLLKGMVQRIRNAYEDFEEWE